MTREELKNFLRYDPLTGLFIRTVTAGGKPAGSIAGYKDPRGYIHIQVNGTIYRAHRLAFLYMTGEFPKYSVDHIDRNPSNNIWTNLRDIPSAENQWNKSTKTDLNSGFTHITRRKNCKSWVVRLGKRHGEEHVGSFKSLDTAISALYDRLVELNDVQSLELFYRQKEIYDSKQCSTRNYTY